MTDRPPRPFLGITPKQGAILAILAGVFGFLLFGQNDGTGEPAEEDIAATESGPRRPSTASAGAAARRTPNWPEIELDQALAHNPFLPLAADETSSPAEQALIDAKTAEAAAGATPTADDAADGSSDAAVAEFQSRGVTMIFRNKDKTCAVIGDRVVQTGDVIDGVRVVAITNTEVVVEPASRPAE
jgi:hypothetical protein